MRLASSLAVALIVGGTLPVLAQSAGAVDSRGQGQVNVELPAPLQRPVSLSMRNAPLLRVVQEIDRQAGLRLGYTDRLLAGHQVTIQVSEVPAREALERALAGTGIVLQVSPRGSVMLVRRPPAGRAATSAADTIEVGALFGAVTDSITGRRLSGVAVTAVATWPTERRGTSRTAITNDSGYYFFAELPAAAYSVTARRVGYRPETREIIVNANTQARVDIEFGLGLTNLDRMVTTATGPQRWIERGNDVTQLKADSITSTQLVRSVSDLIADRVPGLTAMPTTGAPGDPMRLRLRGLHSVLKSDDPMIVVDGIRVYYDQSSRRAGNLAEADRGPQFARTPAPSPLDLIDPNSIERVEVLKGPSAAALYGSDAASGVIVITTKSGRPGPATWTTSLDYGRTKMPGTYPVGYFRWGHPLAQDGPAGYCALRDQTCIVDSIVEFQLLNDPRYTVLGTGDRMAGTVGVSGGNPGLTYNLTASYTDEVGLLRLPEFAAAGFAQAKGFAAPSWMKRPHHFKTWSTTTGVTITPSPKLSIVLTSQLTRADQQRSTLESELPTLMRTYLDAASGQGYVAEGAQFRLVPNVGYQFQQRATARSTGFRNSANANWRPVGWLTTSASVGLDLDQRDDRVLLPRGVSDGYDSTGMIRIGNGNSLVRSVRVNVGAVSPTYRGFYVQGSIGGSYDNKSIADVAMGGRGLAPGTSSLTGAAQIEAPNEAESSEALAGWYLETKLSHKRMWLSPGIRFDGGSAFGSRVTLPTFPQLSYAYLISDEGFFPFRDKIQMLKLRLAYGQAGKTPSISDRLRLYNQAPVLVDSQMVDGTILRTLGNTTLRPERSTQLEGGFDLDAFDQRLGAQVTFHYTKTRDLLLNVPVPPSVYGDQIHEVPRNVGVLRNTGFELSLTTELLRSDPVTFATDFSLSANRNRVLALARGVVPFFNASGDGRVVAGYPLFGRWAKPIVGYRDLDADGVITANEVQIGDTLVYLGESTPNYQATFGGHASFLRGRVTVNASFAYTHGLTQINETLRRSRAFSRAVNDPGTSLSEQAAIAVMDRTDYGLMQTVSTLAFNNLAVAYNAPRRLAHAVGAQALSIAILGANLGLHTNYRGKDPRVNAYSTGSGVVDTGILPTPRTWSLRVSTVH